ncbi:hypothetical protein V6D40_07965 [Corynebacterium sp. Q4381]|uniref:hypothetical protein n=1 Tax=Corynebacterium sp. Marseille-Q4381 TaxID=3121597 RepID=UPI002FE6B3AD
MRRTHALAGVVGLAVACAGVYAVGLATPAAPPAIQGDTLGPQRGETWGEYGERSAASLSMSSGAAFALVSFTHPLTPAEAARAVAPAGRVNGLLLIDAPLQPTPEPTSTTTRADVFARELERLAARARANGVEVDPQRIAAAVVHDQAETLRAIAADDAVAAVEVLPADASWGSFAVTAWQGDHPARGV